MAKEVGEGVGMENQETMDGLENEDINKQVAEILGYRVFRPCDVKWRSAYQKECYGGDVFWRILPKKKRPQTHMIDSCPLPRFTDNMPHAFEILEWIGRQGYAITLHITPIPGKRYFIGVRKPIMSLDKFRAEHESLPRTVCDLLLLLAPSIEKDNHEEI